MNQGGRPPGLKPDGPRIRRLRRDLGLTARELGDKVGRHENSITRAEKGRPISHVTAARLARALGVDLTDILARDEIAA